MKIPRKFHQIWLGRQPMPPEFLAWQKTWTALNPDWEWKLWTESNLPSSQWPELIQLAHGYSQLSNIYRYEILNNEGGVYVDTDCECLKPIEPLISECSAFVVRKKKAVSHDPPINSAIIGCMAHHPLTQALVEHMNTIDPGEKLSLGSSYLTKFVAQRLCSNDVPDVTIIPSELMNPYNQRELDNGRPRQKKDFPGAYVLHHWSSQWHPTGFAKIEGSR